MSRKDTTIDQSLLRVVPPNSSLLLAVSGGIDSMVLLAGLCRIVSSLSLRLGVAHIDHGLRGCSELDSEFVRDETAKHGFPFYMTKLTPPGDGRNIEAWGRAERYAFLKKIREEHGYDWILTAHNANDVAETLVMRLVAGKELNSISFTEERRRLLRPFLNVSRATIERYSKDHGIRFREDPTNQDIGFLRNKVRNLLFPLLEKEFERRVVEILSDQAEDIHEDLQTLNNLAQEVADSFPLANTDKAWRRALKDSLASLPEAIQWRVMRRILAAKLGFNLSRDHSRDLVKLIEGDIVGVELPGGLKLRSHEGGIIFD